MPNRDRRPALFLSSTVADLSEYREVVIHVCDRLGIDVLAMEDFGPDPRTAVALCQAKVQSADLFLGLYAHRYGYQPEGFDGTSITELEYEWASKRRPAPTVLLFLIDEQERWLPKDFDYGPERERLLQFKERLRKKHVVSNLTTPERLKEDLFVHLPKFIEEMGDRPADVKVIPAAPDLFAVHPYALLQTRQVIGRETELGTLDRWVGDPAGELADARLLCIVAIGGMGKSALTWKWFLERAPLAMPQMAGRLWWSFYEADAGFDRFVVTALAYCSGRDPAAVEALSPIDRETQLLSILDWQPFLLVLDGLERVLIAYSNLDFAHLADEQLDEQTANAVAGARGLPQEAGSSFIGQHRLRKTIDPRVGNFLRKLTRTRTARILVTTRLYPSELQTVTGHELPGSAAWFLRGLEAEDALALWRAMGISGSDGELSKVFATIENYPLLIRALAGEVARYRPAPGNFDAWREAHRDFDPFSLPLVQAKSHVLAHALGNLETDAGQLLSTIAAFRSPVAYDTLGALFVQGRGWSPQKLDETLTQVEDRGLVGWDKKTNRYDLHPIVRGVVWRGLDEVARSAVYGALERHFSAIAPSEAKRITLEEASPLIELFTALVGLQRYDDAASLYFQRLHHKFGFLDAGLGHVNIAMLESLFPDGINQPPRTTQYAGGVLAQLGHAYGAYGRLTEAYELFSRALSETSDIHHQNLSEAAARLGRLRQALEEARTVANVPSSNTMSKYFIGLLAICEARVGQFRTAHALLRTMRPDEFFDPDYYRVSVLLFEGRYERAATIARRKITQGTKYPESWSFILAKARIGIGETNEAIGLFADQLRNARAMGAVQLEIEFLVHLADAHRRLGHLAESRGFLDDLAEPAARGPYRLIQADAHNVLAELERDCGNHEAAVAAAQDAYRFAWCDGPPYTYHSALERAKTLLRELKAEPPEL